MGAVVELERSLIRERHRKGIEVAKKKGLLHDQVRPGWVNCEIDLSEENATTMHDALAT
ncbi:hypothetical protein G6557_13540 [Dermacoccus nishinomiyaensis]|nr:hypothetical protein [Dermacoccus nishinomiyaensis]